MDSLDTSCSICLDTFTYPVKTACNHTFCIVCLDTSIRSGNKGCPLCRGEIEPIAQDIEMEKLVGCPPIDDEIMAGFYSRGGNSVHKIIAIRGYHSQTMTLREKYQLTVIETGKLWKENLDDESLLANYLKAITNLQTEVNRIRAI